MPAGAFDEKQRPQDAVVNSYGNLKTCNRKLKKKKCATTSTNTHTNTVNK